MSQSSVEDRILALEKRVRRLAIGLGLTSAVAITLVSIAWRPAPQTDVLRARAIILSDSAGRERVVIGAPVPEPAGARIAPNTGMIIRDSTGAKRFGLGVFPNGMMSMGFDAPQIPGVRGNRERINIVAAPNGLASIRFLNRKSLVAGYLLLDGDDDNLYLQMEAKSPKGSVWRQIGALRDTTIVRPH
jgi:hypothetical protein